MHTAAAAAARRPRVASICASSEGPGGAGLGGGWSGLVAERCVQYRIGPVSIAAETPRCHLCRCTGVRVTECECAMPPAGPMRAPAALVSAVSAE